MKLWFKKNANRQPRKECAFPLVTPVCAHTDDKAEVFIPIRAVYYSQTSHIQTDMYLGMHTQIENARAICNTGHLNYYQLPYINKPWHKNSDESATLNTLEMLPRLAHCRPLGQMGRTGKW